MKCKNAYADEKTYRAAKRRQSERYRARTGSGLYRSPWTTEQLHEVLGRYVRWFAHVINHSFLL